MWWNLRRSWDFIFRPWRAVQSFGRTLENCLLSSLPSFNQRYQNVWIHGRMFKAVTASCFRFMTAVIFGQLFLPDSSRYGNCLLVVASYLPHTHIISSNTDTNTICVYPKITNCPFNQTQVLFERVLKGFKRKFSYVLMQSCAAP